MYRTFGTPSIWREMDRLQRDMNRLFNRYTPADLQRPSRYPAINIWVSEDGQVLSAEMPGVNPEDIDIHVEGDTLTITGERKAADLPEGGRYYRRERGSGQFSRSIQLPFPVDTEKVEARFKDGVLNVTLPRAEADKPKKIAITT